MSSPNRRSTADLQRMLDGLIGDKGSIRCGDLPEVLLKYESEHDVIILEPSEYDGLRTLCGQSPDIELDAKDIFAFLSIMPKVEQSTAPNLPHSHSMPDSALRKAQSTPPVVNKQSRRHSDRVRSPSDSSGSESDRSDRQRKPSVTRPFPGGSVSTPSNIPRPVVPRVKKLSDPARLESPLAIRRRGSQQPPSAYSPFGAFSRPSPASRRRRGSSESSPGADTGIDLLAGSRSTSQPRHRTVSQDSMRASSPLWSGSQSSHPASPLSPMFPSFQASVRRAGSAHPESPQEAADLEDADTSLQAEDLDLDGLDAASMAEEETDRVDDDLAGPGLHVEDSLNPRLSRISTGSVASLKTSHDKLQVLQKQNGELARKLKEADKQLAVIGTENERMVEDLQERLEEARAEIALKRKDEKDYKSKDRAQMIQIAGFEADISSLQRSLEAAKANHANMSKMYNSQCDEAQRLRDLLRDRDDEIQRLEDAYEVHEGEESKYTRELEVLEGEVKRLERELSVARQAESHLESQKQENLQLKETIDRMRFDLDEAKTQNSLHGHSRGATSSGAGTMSRNLGAEISRRLVDADPTTTSAREGQEDDSDNSDVVETVVTTRTKKQKGKNPIIGHSTAVDESDITPPVPVSTAYVDVAIATDPPVSPVAEPATFVGSPPAYSAEAEPINAQQVIDKAHPRGVVDGLDDRYDSVVQATGLRCTVLEAKLKAARSTTSRPWIASSPDDQLSGYISLASHLFSQYGSYLVAAFAVGVLFGFSLFGSSSRDVALFRQMNTLALAAGAGEGFLPFGQRGVVGFAESGAKMVAGRVPA